MLRALLKRIRPGAAPAMAQEQRAVASAARQQRPMSTEAAATASSSSGEAAAAADAGSSGRLDALDRAYATGRRKTSVARVWLREGDGRIVVNDKELHEYFGRAAYRDKLVEPFAVTGTAGRFDVTCTVKGGGTTGQVGAIALGISRALEVWDPTHRPALAKESLFTRDSRKVERKKPGQPKARKQDQWVKR